MSKPEAETKSAFLLKLTTPQLWVLTLIIAAIYYIYSYFSDGFYQHDEAAHYLSMRRFWYDPNIILGNWAKPGYKLITAPVALLGTHVLIIFNSLIAAFSCHLAYRVAEQVKAKAPVFAPLFLFLQPFWIQLSFRNYSELISALILILAVLYHYKQKEVLAALFLSYLVLIRQEAYLIVAAYGLYLLYKRKLIPVLCLAVFPVIHNVWGWLATGDPLYLLNEVLGFSSTAQDAYPRQGFWHYFKMSLTVFGGLTLTFFIAYLAQNIFRKKKWHWFILTPALLYFFAHVLFSIQSFKIGPSTGGNLRYLVVISPLLAVLGGMALERVSLAKGWKEKQPLLYLLVPFAVIVFAFLSYEHNQILFTEEEDYLPFLTVLISAALIIPNLSAKKLVIGSTLVAIIIALMVVRPLPRTNEDRIVASFVETAKAQNLDRFPILANHTLFYYFWGKVEEEFENGAAKIDEGSVASAEEGTIIVWDSHYSYRPRLHPDHLSYTYFQEHPVGFRAYYRPMVTPDQRFAIFTYQKTGDE